jgi:general nucleoside transport system permease protein
MSTFLSLAFLAQVLRISVPYVLAALGGTLSERSGVINLALEGILLGSALTATLGSEQGGVAAGLFAGVAGGLLVASIYALVVLRFRADQIVAGVAVNLLVLGLTRFVLKLVWGSASSSPSVPGFGPGPAAGLFMAAVGLLAVGLQVWLGRTAFGLRLRATGEHPEAVDSLGVDVLRVRWRALLAAGALAGLGGAWLALDNHGFVDRMSGGRGYIALAAMIFGRWKPVGVTLACLLFGFTDALQLNLQGQTSAIPRELLQMLPYLLTIVTLAGVIGRSRAPQALGRPWWGR